MLNSIIFFIRVRLLERYFIYKKDLANEVLLEAFKAELTRKNKKFVLELDEDLIAITGGYYIYPFIDGMVKDLEYLIVMDHKQKSGKLDMRCNVASKEFILNELNTSQFQEETIALEELNIFNQSDIKKYEDKFISLLLERTEHSICQRHNLILTDKNNSIDIAPIREFNEINKRYYLEEVYIMEYFEKGKRNVYKSVFSSYFQKFYTFDFIKTMEYTNFYKKFRSPVAYIPKEYIDFYYDIAYQVYLNTCEELKYIKESELLAKVRKNVQYEEYSMHEEYLDKLIFYFKKKTYLSSYSKRATGLKYDVFYCYLTLKFNPQSGYQLASYVKDNIIEDNYIKLLTCSQKQGNSLAKKALYEYYVNPQTYNAYYVKRYS